MAAGRYDRWIPWTFVGGMALVIVVNAVMVWFALSTFTGTTVDRAYERGRLYNTVLAEAERQARFGWRFSLRWEPKPGEPLEGRFVLDAAGPDGAGLDRLALEAAMVRPLEAPEPVPLGFTQIGPGRYAATVVLPRPGQWEVRLAAQRGEDGPVEHRQRIVAR
ncbi:FixH family protein [Elioraea rosea]|uniref:FixH family protein n=1 Tax=Elioraea rosea TaxID=2492390 RepID=UPI001EF7460B|nr:FixH family protein [Elioraea rosea]